MIRLSSLRAQGLALVTFLGVLAGTATAQSRDDAPLRYGRVTAEKARVLNLADEKGVAVATPAKDTLVAIYEENATGWLSIEIPGGFQVWVSGRYLEPTEESGVFEVTRNAVNIRPGPSSDVTNFPLPQRLHAGDRVRLIETLDDGPLADTWARILSPPGVRAWIRASSVGKLAAGEDGAAAWKTALVGDARATGGQATKNASAPAKSAVATPAGAGTAPAQPTPEERVRLELDAARSEVERESKRDYPNYAIVRSTVEGILTKAPAGPTAIGARETLRRIDALEEAAALKAALEAERARRLADATAAERAVLEAGRAKDPLGGVFASRGVLLRRTQDGVPTYVLRFGRETVAELFCSSERYDLSLFAGFEVGVQAATLAAPESREIPVLDVSRIEVIRRR